MIDHRADALGIAKINNDGRGAPPDALIAPLPDSASFQSSA
jgi:hypothetical protein